MNEWILIFLLWLNKGGGTAVIEFPTQNACRNAGEKILAAHKPAQYICVPRNV
jgi:hypothetical protein